MTAPHPSNPSSCRDCQFPPQTIALIGKYQSREIAESLSLLAKNLHDRGVGVLVEEATASLSETGAEPHIWTRCSYAEIGARADAAIVLGGDGTMLNAARHLARHRVPLVGVNQGRLGFMTDIARADMLTCVDDLLAGKFTAESRMLLSGEIVRDGRVVASNLALNEVVVDKGAIGRLIDFDLYVDGEFLYNLRSDGVIVSTPTGSTAYSLAANGPILHPQVTGIALVPLCPHSLTNRPVLVGDRNAIEIRIVHADDSRVHFDGQVTFDMKPGDAMRIRRSEDSVCFLHPPGYSYFAMLREKLHWSRQPTTR
jgi:NAD+ kinase